MVKHDAAFGTATSGPIVRGVKWNSADNALLPEQFTRRAGVLLAVQRLHHLFSCPPAFIRTRARISTAAGAAVIKVAAAMKAAQLDMRNHQLARAL
jgi:hypothetical protein